MCFLLSRPSQSVSPSRPLPSLTMWAGQPESCPSRRGHPCCFTNGLLTTGGKAGTMASTDSSPISTSWFKTRTLGPLTSRGPWLHCGSEASVLESQGDKGDQPPRGTNTVLGSRSSLEDHKSLWRTVFYSCHAPPPPPPLPFKSLPVSTHPHLSLMSDNEGLLFDHSCFLSGKIRLGKIIFIPLSFF